MLIIDKVIAECIRSTTRLTIPEVGMLIRRDNGSIVMIDMMKGDDGSLREAVAGRIHIDNGRAAEMVEAFSVKVRHELQSKGFYTIEGLGRLVKADGHIRFVEADELPAAPPKADEPFVAPAPKVQTTVVAAPKTERPVVAAPKEEVPAPAVEQRSARKADSRVEEPAAKVQPTTVPTFVPKQEPKSAPAVEPKPEQKSAPIIEAKPEPRSEHKATHRSERKPVADDPKSPFVVVDADDSEDCEPSRSGRKTDLEDVDKHNVQPKRVNNRRPARGKIDIVVLLAIIAGFIALVAILYGVLSSRSGLGELNDRSVPATTEQSSTEELPNE